MSGPRIYIDQPLTPDGQLQLPEAQARHLIQVLRLRVGAPLALFNGDGLDYPATLLAADRRRASVQIASPMQPAEPLPPLALHLGLGISKGERMDWAIQKSVELGVAAITPLVTERTVVRVDEQRRQKKQQHWQGVLIGACEQSGRRRLPSLHNQSTLNDWLAGPTDDALCLLLDHRSEQTLPQLSRPTSVRLLVGPEGGLGEAERERARQAGFVGVRLGPRVLRTETAPLAALAAMQVLWGDLAG